MTYDPKKHHRCSIRLDGYDYAQAGACFVTICVQGHRYLFGQVEGEEMQLDQAGSMVQAVWDELPRHYPGVETDAFVVMPNHVHGIIVLDLVGAGPRACPGLGQPRGVAPTGRALSLTDVVHRFKTFTTKQYSDAVKQRGWRPFAGRLWQRNYYEHIIRNDVALNRIRQYIAENPARWSRDPDNPSAVHPDAPDPWRQ